MQKKKILILTPRFPYPVIGGDRLRIFNIAKGLSDEFSVSLLSLCESKLEMNVSIPNDHIFETVYRCYLPKWKSYLNCFLCLFRDEPLQVAYYKSKMFKSLFERIKDEYDVVLVHLIRMAPYALSFSGLKILEMTDAISMNYQKFISNSVNIGVRSYIYKHEYLRVNKFEKNIASKFDVNVLISNVDRVFLFEELQDLMDKTLVCSNGVSLVDAPKSVGPELREIIFIGNMYSVQNFDAAYWFAVNVMPLLSRIDNFSFKVIGKIPNNFKEKLTSLPNVYVTGIVDNVYEESRSALLGVCPVRVGAGVQNKILEYMAFHLPVISSSTGLEGLNAKVGEDILLADSPEEYVTQILHLITDRSSYENISENGYNYVASHHSWSDTLLPLIKKIKSSLSA